MFIRTMVLSVLLKKNIMFIIIKSLWEIRFHRLKVPDLANEHTSIQSNLVKIF